jgi:hypothetical protein
MGAKAPRPGVGRRLEETSKAQDISRISFKGSEPLSLAVRNLPLREKMQVQFQTEKPIEYWWGGGFDRVSSISFAVLWWLARRANGESQLTFDEVCADMDGAAISDFTLVIDDEDDDSPEG